MVALLSIFCPPVGIVDGMAQIECTVHLNSSILRTMSSLLLRIFLTRILRSSTETCASPTNLLIDIVLAGIYHVHESLINPHQVRVFSIRLREVLDD